MPRVVDLRLAKLLQERDIDVAELATHLDVSEATVRAYIRNRWTVLDRTVLERLADFFQCDAGSLIETTESHFFDPFRPPPGVEKSTPPKCIFLRRPDAETEQSGRKRSYRDNRAIELVETLLQNSVEGLVGMEYASTGPDDNQHFSQNCVVVGSPMVNPAAEKAICRIFGAEPLGPGQSAKLPFSFRVAANAALRDSSVVEASLSTGQGIWLREENELVEADHWPPEEFRRLRIKRGRDCGVVLVMNHRPAGQSGNLRKLIVLGGFTGAATEAAAKALVDHYRDLDPREGTDPVWGVIEVFYHKPARNTTRTILN